MYIWCCFWYNVWIWVFLKLFLKYTFTVAFEMWKTVFKKQRQKQGIQTDLIFNQLFILCTSNWYSTIFLHKNFRKISIQTSYINKKKICQIVNFFFYIWGLEVRYGIKSLALLYFKKFQISKKKKTEVDFKAVKLKKEENRTNEPTRDDIFLSHLLKTLPFFD